MNLLFSCIGRRGYIAQWFRQHLAPTDRILGTSNTPWTPGFHACDAAFLMPDISDESYISRLLELCREERVDSILSFFDLDVDLIARHRDLFTAAGVTLMLPDARVSAIGLDKLATCEFLQGHGLSVPQTFTDLDGAKAALEEGLIDWPVIVKPRFGYASRSVSLAQNEQQLVCYVSSAPDMLVQERLSGQEHSLDVLNDLAGQVVSVVAKRKVLMRAGETDQAVSVHHAGAVEVGERIGAALRHVGPLDVDLFIDGDSIVVLEINPRFGGAYACSHLAGADFPLKILRMLRDEPVSPDIGQYSAGVGMMKDYVVVPQYGNRLVDLRG